MSGVKTSPHGSRKNVVLVTTRRMPNYNVLTYCIYSTPVNDALGETLWYDTSSSRNRCVRPAQSQSRDTQAARALQNHAGWDGQSSLDKLFHSTTTSCHTLGNDLEISRAETADTHAPMTIGASNLHPHISVSNLACENPMVFLFLGKA